MSIIAMALVVSCALIATAQLQSEESVLFGLGSGEEQVVLAIRVCESGNH